MEAFGRWLPLFLTTCSDDSKPYMILKALDKSYKNHIGFAIIRASDEEQWLPTSETPSWKISLFCSPEVVETSLYCLGPEAYSGYLGNFALFWPQSFYELL